MTRSFGTPSNPLIVTLYIPPVATPVEVNYPDPEQRSESVCCSFQTRRPPEGYRRPRRPTVFALLLPFWRPFSIPPSKMTPSTGVAPGGNRALFKGPASKTPVLAAFAE